MSLRQGGKPRKVDVRIRQNPLGMSSFSTFATMQVSDGMYLATLSFSVCAYGKARGRWGGNLTSLGTGKMLWQLPARRAKAIAEAFFDGRPVSVL